MKYDEVLKAIKDLESRTMREEIVQQKLEEDLKSTEDKLRALGGFLSRKEAEEHLAEIRDRVGKLSKRADEITEKISQLQGSALHLV